MEEITLEERRKRFAEKFVGRDHCGEQTGNHEFLLSGSEKQQPEAGGRTVEGCRGNDGYMPGKGKGEDRE